MSKVPRIEQRKTDHIKINLEKDVQSGLTNGLENYRFIHEALPEMDLETVTTSIKLFGKELDAPILVSSMTGGSGRNKNHQHETCRSFPGNADCNGCRQPTRRA